VTRILGVDPGSRATGWAVIEAEGSRLRLCASGVLRPRGEARAARFAWLYRNLGEIVAREAPETAAVESPFAGVNVRSALALAEARGVVLAALGGSGLEVTALSPAEVKSAVVGTGRADKRQVAFMVVRLLGLDATPPEDAADAMAVAIAHWRHASWSTRLRTRTIPPR